MLRANNLSALVSTCDLDGRQDEETAEARSIQTYYEGMWLSRGLSIKYLRFRLPLEGELVEPDVEIPLDEYRSYSRDKRSGCVTHK